MNVPDKLNELASIYQWRHIEAHKLGLEQKSWEFSQISDALTKEALRQEIGETHICIDRIMRWNPEYHSLRHLKCGWPKFYVDEGETWWQAMKTYLFDSWHWDIKIWPSFPRFFYDIWQNIENFFYWMIFPWFHIRYWFIEAFSNLNSSKVIHSNIRSTYVRNRQHDTIYYYLKFCGLHYSLIRSRILIDGEENGQNEFMLGLKLGLGDFADEQFEEEKKKFTK